MISIESGVKANHCAFLPIKMISEQSLGKYLDQCELPDQ